MRAPFSSDTARVDARDLEAPNPEGISWSEAERSPSSTQRAPWPAAGGDLEDGLPPGGNLDDGQPASSDDPASLQPQFRLPVSVYYKHYAGHAQKFKCPEAKHLHWLNFTTEDELRTSLYNLGAGQVRVYLGNKQGAEQVTRRFTQGIATFAHVNGKLTASLQRELVDGTRRLKRSDVHLSVVFLRDSHSYVLPSEEGNDIVNPPARKKTFGASPKSHFCLKLRLLAALTQKLL